MKVDKVPHFMFGKKTSLLLIRLNSLTKIVEAYNHQNDEDAGENHQNEATEHYSNHNPDIHAGVWIWKYNKVSKQLSCDYVKRRPRFWYNPSKIRFLNRRRQNSHASTIFFYSFLEVR